MITKGIDTVSIVLILFRTTIWKHSYAWPCIKLRSDLHEKYTDFQILVLSSQNKLLWTKILFFFFCMAEISSVLKWQGIRSSLNFQNFSLIFQLVNVCGNFCTQAEITQRAILCESDQSQHTKDSSQNSIYKAPPKGSGIPFIYRAALHRSSLTSQWMTFLDKTMLFIV